jgi:hypothetical protein
MRTLAATAGNPAPLPDADLIWQRARTRERWRQYELATRPIRVAERTACVVCAAAGLVALFALRPGVEAALGVMNQTLVRVAGVAFAATATIALVLLRALSAEE